MRYYAIRHPSGPYALEQESDGHTYKQIIARATVNPALRVKLDANPGVRVEIGK